jgi:hypothetical protein
MWCSQTDSRCAATPRLLKSGESGRKGATILGWNERAEDTQADAGIRIVLIGGWDGLNAWFSVNAGTWNASAVGSLADYTDNFSSGSYPGTGGSLPTDGCISQVAPWFRSLSTGEVSTLYNGGSPIAVRKLHNRIGAARGWRIE